MGGGVLIAVLLIPWVIATLLVDYMIFPVLSGLFLDSFHVFNGDTASGIGWYLYLCFFIPAYVVLVYAFIRINNR